jgi:hypothetical protein
MKNTAFNPSNFLPFWGEANITPKVNGLHGYTHSTTGIHWNGNEEYPKFTKNGLDISPEQVESELAPYQMLKLS